MRKFPAIKKRKHPRNGVLQMCIIYSAKSVFTCHKGDKWIVMGQNKTLKPEFIKLLNNGSFARNSVVTENKSIVLTSLNTKNSGENYFIREQA